MTATGAECEHLDALAARYHQAFNDRDFDVWREVFADDVELIVDGTTFKGVDAAVAYGAGEDRALRIAVSDDGAGGAQSRGTGLVGLQDRVAAVDGSLCVDSPAGGGTVVAATLPLRD